MWQRQLAAADVVQTKSESTPLVFMAVDVELGPQYIRLSELPA